LKKLNEKKEMRREMSAKKNLEKDLHLTTPLPKYKSPYKVTSKVKMFLE
jgi:hypothetical protein